MIKRHLKTTTCAYLYRDVNPLKYVEQNDLRAEMLCYEPERFVLLKTEYDSDCRPILCSHNYVMLFWGDLSLAFS